MSFLTLQCLILCTRPLFWEPRSPHFIREVAHFAILWWWIFSGFCYALSVKKPEYKSVELPIPSWTSHLSIQLLAIPVCAKKDLPWISLSSRNLYFLTTRMSEEEKIINKTWKVCCIPYSFSSESSLNHRNIVPFSFPTSLSHSHFQQQHYTHCFPKEGVYVITNFVSRACVIWNSDPSGTPCP